MRSVEENDLDLKQEDLTIQANAENLFVGALLDGANYKDAISNEGSPKRMSQLSNKHMNTKKLQKDLLVMN